MKVNKRLDPAEIPDRKVLLLQYTVNTLASQSKIVNPKSKIRFAKHTSPFLFFRDNVPASASRGYYIPVLAFGDPRSEAQGANPSPITQSLIT
jgi:hypothetical protein